MGRVIVTGAAGFIGSHLVDRLLADGHEVVGIDGFTPYYPSDIKRRNVAEALANPRFRLVTADLAQLDLKPYLPADAVFHLAAQAGVRSSWGRGFDGYVRHNVVATQRLLESLRGGGCGRLIFASTSAVYGNGPLPARESGPLNPVSPYGVTKLAAEHLVRAYGQAGGPPYVILRYFTVYGPRQRPDMAIARFIAAVRAGRELTVYGTGDQTRDFTFVSDAVEATVLAWRQDAAGLAFNVGGGGARSVNDVLEALGRASGLPVRVRREPAQVGDAAATLADLTLARTVLGFRPRVGLEEGIRRQWEWEGGKAGEHRLDLHR
ncbi:MAG: NAD-dependent epimerase/dehydratase family protein [Firmicutes bacterium]|nr:NAD-dependent epimerase/dehydratase family protein [Bacillota bacterium]